MNNNEGTSWPAQLAARGSAELVGADAVEEGGPLGRGEAEDRAGVWSLASWTYIATSIYVTRYL